MCNATKLREVQEVWDGTVESLMHFGFFFPRLLLCAGWCVCCCCCNLLHIGYLFLVKRESDTDGARTAAGRRIVKYDRCENDSERVHRRQSRVAGNGNVKFFFVRDSCLCSIYVWDVCFIEIRKVIAQLMMTFTYRIRLEYVRCSSLGCKIVYWHELQHYSDPNLTWNTK